MAEPLRQRLKIQGLLLLYVGNLETYQGIDLLLESFALVRQWQPDLEADLVIIGGQAADIEAYQTLAQHLSIEQRVHFLGARPIEHLAGYLQQADILVSPRIKGKNTPMKLYSYLDSGRAVLATDLPTHTQLLTEEVACLAEPTADKFAQGLLRLAGDTALRAQLGKAGQALIAAQFSYDVFTQKLNGLFDWLTHRVEKDYQARQVAPQPPQDFELLRKMFSSRKYLPLSRLNPGKRLKRKAPTHKG
jgi:glycosyltransferase involved in cell wall biosynthesis